MPADMYTVNRTKELILAFIRARGPSLPVHIARDVKTSPLFAAAFLSELYNEGKIKMSALKVGSSSLYYLAGQEEQLENFIVHLNTREKEAVALLKKSQLLEDEKLEPVHRVALRAVKDFAIPIQVPRDGTQKIFWKYFSLADTETPRLLAAAQNTLPEPVPHSALTPLQPAPQPPLIPATSLEQAQPAPPVQSAPRPKRASEPLKKRESPVLSLPFPAKAPTPQPLVKEFPFVNTVKAHLARRNMDLTQTLLEQKKEFHGKVTLETPLGQQSYFLIAKDKKRLKSEELIEALQKAHAERMPALLLAPGDLDKQAKMTLAEWSNFLKFEKPT